MKNKLMRGVLGALALVTVFKISWADTLSLDDRARMGGVYSMERLKQYAKAMPVITDLYQRHPEDREVKWTYARILGFGGHWKEAADVFDQLCANGCSHDELLSYAHVLEAQGPNPDALAKMKPLAEGHPDQPELQSIYSNMVGWGQKSAPANAPVSVQNTAENDLLNEARTLSWHDRFKESVRVYQKLIDDHPDNVLYYREQARVLGWWGHVTEATRVYDKACRRFPDNEALQAEARAKKAYYNNLYAQARHYYGQWLELEPESAEARFDLGQIHANSKQYAAAETDYDEILKQSPDNASALTVRDKAQVYSHDWRLESGFLHDEASSKTRQVDYRLYDAYEDIEKSFLGNMAFGIRSDEMEYAFPGPLSDVRRYKYTAQLEQDFLPDAFWKLDYGLSNSSNDDKHLQYRDAEIQLPVFTERLLLDVSYKRDDFIQNEAMLAEHLQEDQYRARATWTPIRPLEIGIDEAHSQFTDGNRLDNFGGDVGWNILYDPNQLTVRYRWQDWRFAEIEPQYFSPGNFTSQRISVEWRQFLNRNNLYWGTNKFSYFLRYEFINDQGEQRGNSGSIGFDWSMSKRLTLRLQAQRISYDHPGIYTDNEQTASIIYAF